MKYVVFFGLLSLPFMGFAQTKGKVMEGLKVESKILGKPVRYTIYLPADYETSNRYYPVVYLLHGYSDDDTGWLQFGEANRIADEGIASGEIPPMIIVMPDGGVSFYINNHDKSVRWEDFFLQEFMPTIEKTYRIRTKKEYRGIAGLSMGGYGATVLAMRNPDLFAACAAFSSAYFTAEEMANMPAERHSRSMAGLFGAGEGQARLTPHFYAHNPIDIAKKDPEKIKQVRWYVDCGDDDFLYKGNDAFHTAMRDLNIPHEYRVRDGAHTWGYWRTGLPDGLKFIGASFHR